MNMKSVRNQKTHDTLLPGQLSHGGLMPLPLSLFRVSRRECAPE